MSKAVQRLIQIHADADGNLPERIHLMSVGHWHTPWHGAFEMTSSDLADMIANFQAGIGLVEASTKVPINYGHDISGKAAGWITGLSLENNGTELWGDVEWTPEGERMLKDQEFKYISPEWNPRSLPWENPEVEGEYVDNVFTGAGLTNIPLFKKLTPVMASVVTGNGDKPNEGANMLKLEEVRVKKPDELTDEEKAFLAEHVEELTDEERQTFALVDESDDESAGDDESDEGEGEEAQAKREEQAVHASLKGYTPEKLAQLEADAKAGREAQQELLKTRLTASVEAHVDRGAIKSDQAKEAVEILMASSEAQRDRLTKFFASLPDNKLVTSGEKGKGVKAAADIQLTAEEIEYGAQFNLTEEQIRDYKLSKEGN